MSEDEEKKRQRAERFGMEYDAPDETGLMDVGTCLSLAFIAKTSTMCFLWSKFKRTFLCFWVADLFEERKDAPTTATRRPEAIHVYGVDLLSTKDLLTYFADYGTLLSPKP